MIDGSVTRSNEVTMQSVLYCKVLEYWGALAFLAVTWLFLCSWAFYHTSFERGESGLPADAKIRIIVQLIGIS